MVSGAKPAPFAAEFTAAGVAAAVELTIMQPLDVIKTRLHLQSARQMHGDRFTSTTGALRSIHRAEGMRGLWRGFGTGMTIVVPRRGLKFAANSGFASSQLLSHLAPRERCLLAGGLAGVCEAILITPLETCKIALQSERTPRGAVPSGAAQTIWVIVQRGGVAGLYSGLIATMCKHSLHSCVYFASFAELRTMYGPQQDAATWEHMRFSACAGFAAGVAAGTVNNPFDVVKSQMQVVAAADLGGHSLAKEYAASGGQGLGLLPTMARLLRTDGLSAFSRGLGAKLLRLGPGSAIIFTVYETTLRLSTAHFVRHETPVGTG